MSRSPRQMRYRRLVTPRLPISVPADAQVRGARAFADQPPPYYLNCDLATITLLVETRSVCEWANIPAARARRLPLAVLLARYHRGRYGPTGTPVEPLPGRQYVYDEVTFALAHRGMRAGCGMFPALWLDTPEPNPIDLGWHYGFPKFPGTIDWRQTGSRLSVSARPDGQEELDSDTPRLHVRARTFGLIPAAPLVARIAGRAEFPLTGRRATMRIESAQRARLLLIRELRLDNLPISGRFKTMPVGTWLENAWLLLGPPDNGE